ncbi:MAG: bifunctional DNA primase/polymerase [Candidatus Thiothrix moscowensis]|nr:bifunctional DNA primase/polymerase [Candidatus Thiothrix moscowensis]
MSSHDTTNSGKSTTTAANGGKKRKSGERRGIRLNPAIDNVKALGVDVSGSSNGLGRAGGVDAGVGMDAACQMAQDTAAFDLSKRPAYLMGKAVPELDRLCAQIRSLHAPETLIAAVTYAAHGWRVFPLAEDSKIPLAGSDGFKAATTDRTQHIAWFDDGEYFEYFRAGGNPRLNVGIATGATEAGYDLVVLDVDVKGGKDGNAVLKALEGAYGALPATLVQNTPSGGLHYLFRVAADAGIRCGTDVFKAHGSGLDVRGDGGYIVASPSEVDGKPYTWRNDLLLAELPGAWVQALRGECPAGGKRGAVSASNGERAQVVRGELLPMPEDVQAALAEHAVPSSVGRVEWLSVLSVLSAFVDGENAARKWSSSGEYADKFNEAEFSRAWAEVHGGWNDGVPMAPGVLFNLVQAQGTGWKTPEQRRKAAQAAAQPRAQAEASGVPWTLGDVPEYLQPLQPHTDAAVSVQALGGEELEAAAQATLREVTATAEAVWARAQRSAAVGHDAEWLFIAGMLAMNADWVKYQVEHNPVPSGRSSPYLTSKGTIRAVIMHSDGSKPQTAETVDMERFTPDWAGGTADAVTRLAGRLMLQRDAARGSAPTATENVLVHKVVEISTLGMWWVDSAASISAERNGWSLKSAVGSGLARAKRYSTNTQAALSKSGRGLITGEIPKTGGRLSWIDKELTHHGGAVGELLDTPTSDQIESLLGVYGCRAVFDEMRGKVAVHGLPKRFMKLDDIVTAIRELATRHGTEWRKADVTDFLKLLANGTGYHPALEWVRRIPWDGVDRFGALLATVEPEEDYGGLWRIGLHRWCMGAVRCLVQPEGMRGVPTIVFYAPAGGEGKDMWQSSLCPLEYQARPNGFDPGNLNWMLAALNGWLGIFPEITTQSRKADIEHVKAFLTADKDSYTSKYEMDVNDRLRRTVYLASTNESDYLADRTGTNRRFITIAVKSINYRHSIDMQQFWAQMLHTFEAAWAVSDEQVHRYWLEGEESRLLAKVNEMHTVDDLLEDQIKELWDFDDETWQRDKHRADWAVSVRAVAKKLDPDSAMNTSNVPQMFMKRITREMSRLGVSKKQMRGEDGKTNYYLLPPSKPMKQAYTAYTK